MGGDGDGARRVPDAGLSPLIRRTFQRPFDLFLTAERVRGYKPARWHFRGFELLTRVDRRAWVHVGCSWYHDVAPARALGVTCVLLDRERAGEAVPGAPLRVQTTAGVLEAIECLVA